MNRFLSRLAIGSAAILIASAGGCIAFVFVVVAFYLGLAQIMPAWAAALATAGAAIVLSLIVLLLARIFSGGRVSAEQRARQRNAAELGELLGRQAHSFLSSNSPAVLGALLAAGFAIGFSPKLRKFLMKLL